MPQKQFFNFAVVQRFKDYLHFKIDYSYRTNSCEAEGMGWVLDGKVFYYLNHVYLNDAYAYPKKLNLAGVKETNSRIVFFDPELTDRMNEFILNAIQPGES